MTDVRAAKRQQRRLLVILSATMLVATLNTSAPLASILPEVQRTFNSDLATISWVLTIYQLGSAALVLTLGRMGDMYGHRRLLLVGLALFAASSLACGLAPTVWALIAARAAQGITAAIVFASVPALLTRSFPRERRGEVLGYQVTVATFGMTAGPVIAGWLTDQLGWRAVFLASAPGALAGLIGSWGSVPREAPSSADRELDLWGSATLAFGLGGMLLALSQGPSWGWASPATLLIAGASSAILVAFVIVERTSRAPILDLGLFRQRALIGASLGSIANYIGLSGLVVLLPIYLVQGRGYDTTQAALFLVTQPLARTVVGPLCGKLSDRLGTRPLTVSGLGLYAAGLGLLAQLGPSSAIWQIVAALLVAGVGAGAFLAPNMSAIMGSVPRDRQGIASGIATTARNVGISVGVVLIGTIATSVAGPQPSPAQLFEGVRWGFLIAAGLVAAGAAVSAWGSERPRR